MPKGSVTGTEGGSAACRYEATTDGATTRRQYLANVSEDTQPAAAQASSQGAPLNSSQDAATLLVEWAITPVGGGNGKPPTLTSCTNRPQ